VSRYDRPLEADVLIAGAGPSGLIVGCEAALGGAKVTILEKRDGPTWARAGSIAPRVMEIFESRGIADRILARAHELHENPHVRQGIWAGLRPIHYAALDSDYKSILMLTQIEIERLLAEHFVELGGDLRRKSEVTGLTQYDDSIEVGYRDAAGTARTVRGQYLVGADGNRSVVREAAGIGRHGTPAQRIAINVDAFAPNPNGEVLMVANDEHGWSMTYPLRDGVTRFAMIDALTCTQIPEGPIGLEQAKAMLRRVHGTDYGITKVEAINSFHDALYRADRIRDRRVFLVGESVRVHYPASGVGMNFCIQDGFNLGWKLAAAVKGRGADWLLESYVSERLPEINALIDDVRRQCAIQFNFDAEHMALKRFLETDVLPVPAVNRKICENLAGLSAKYPAPEASAAIVGSRLPNLSLRDGSKVFSLLRRQAFVLLDLTGSSSLPEIAKHLPVVAGSAYAGDRALLAGLATVLMRPDGHVAWASEKSLNEYLPENEVRHWLNVHDEEACLWHARR
jgi:2-polyprenyl-6-methoxyphenol hydroxylase-like FAD-dependent oxidoreductase